MEKIKEKTAEIKKVKVIKADGSEEEFDPNVILNSCIEAGIDFWLSAEVAMEIAKEVKKTISSRDIQAKVIEKLYSKNIDAAEKYRSYYSIYVRSSRNIIEDFDRKKIVKSLVKETELPAEIAEAISKEAENDIRKMNLRFVSAPLIREIVNVKLVEHGYEEARAKYTRLGMPIYDVHEIIKKHRNPEEAKEKMAGNMIREYSLLRILPLHVGDAHMKGEIFIYGLEYFPLKAEKGFIVLKDAQYRDAGEFTLILLSEINEMRKKFSNLGFYFEGSDKLFFEIIKNAEIKPEFIFTASQLKKDISKILQLSIGFENVRKTVILNPAYDRGFEKINKANNAVLLNSFFSKETIENICRNVIQSVAINLARAAYHADKHDEKLFDVIERYLYYAKDIFEIKKSIFRENYSTGAVFELKIAGLKEAVELYSGERIEKSKYAKELAEKIVLKIKDFFKGNAVISHEDNESVLKRFAALDYAEYARVKGSGYAEALFYINVSDYSEEEKNKMLFYKKLQEHISIAAPLKVNLNLSENELINAIKKADEISLKLWKFSS